jgi:TP901 family phage tail tape measure protein
MATRTISTKLAIEGESEYRQSVTNINNSLKTLKSELALVESQFRGNANSQAALKAKGEALSKQFLLQTQKLNETEAALENAKKSQEKYASAVADYSAKIASAKQKLEALKSSTEDTTKEQKKLNEEISAYKDEQAKAQSYQTAAQRGVEDWQRKVNYARRDLNDLNGKIEENNKYLGECTRKTNYCATSIDEYGKKTNQAAKELKNANEVMNAMAAALASAGIARGIGEIKDALEACVDASKDFESAMSSVQALSGASAEEFQQLSDMAKRMGETTKYTAAESADAFGYMALAGWDTRDMLSGIEPILKLATAASMDLGQASDIVTDYLTAFGLTAQDAAGFVDQMAYAMANSNTDVAQLGEAYKNCAATAKSLGYSVEDTTAVLMTMANAGIKGGEAGTALNAVMTRLATDTKGCATALSEYGVRVYDANGNMQSLSSILNGVSEAWGNLTDEQQANLAKTIAGTNQYSAFQTIMNGCGEAAAEAGQSFNDYAVALENCSGAAGKMADTMLDNLNGKLTLMGSAFDSLKIAIGDTLSPALEELAESGTDAFSWAADFVEQNPWLVQALAGATTAAVTFSAAITGLTVINKLTHMVEGATGALNALQIVLAAHPAVAVATAVSGLAVALGSFIASAKKASEENRDFLNSLEESKKAFEETADSIQKGADDTLSMVSALENLMEVEVKSTAQKQAMADLVDQLNEAVPELSLAYDAQTDSLNMTAGSIRELAKAQAEQQMQAAEVQRLSELYVEQAQIATDLAAAEYQLKEAQAALNAMQEAGTYGTVGYEAETANAEQAVVSAKKSVDELTAAQSENQEAVEALEGKYADAQAAVENTGAAAEGTAQQLEELTAASEDLTNTTKSLSDEVGMLSGALQEQQKSGSLSLNTTLELIDAGYAAALSINEETGAITLNKEAYIEIAKAKLDEQIASLQTQQTSIQTAIQLKQEAMTVLTDAWAYAELKKAKDELEGLEGQSKAYEAQIAALEKLKNSLGTVTTATKSASKATASASKQVKTQAEKDLATYRELKATLDHDKAMDLVSERDYYAKLKKYRDQYLTDDDNLDEYRKITEQIYSYDKSLADKENALWEEQTKALVSELEARFKSAMEEQDKMEQRLADYGDLFKIEEDKMSLANIQDQIDAINDYEEALTGLKERGISDSLMDEVLGMNVDDATQYARQLISMTEDQWDQYNTLWEEKQKRAVEVAKKFYQDQLDALKTEYDDKLGVALGVLTDTAYTSGVDTAQSLIDGLAAKESTLYAKAKTMADEVSRILSDAYSASGNVDGSHAAGLAYVPYDGYIAELHQGERVLTKEEAQAYIARSIPSTYDIPRDNRTQMIGDMLSNAVNAIGTVSAGTGARSKYVIELHMDVNGKEFYRDTIDDLRSVMKSNPEAVNDR